MGKVETKCAILEVLSKATEPMRPLDIGEIVGLTALNAGNYLTNMAKSGLVQKPDKKKAFYEMTEKGRQYLENPPEEIKEEEPKGSTEARSTSKEHKRSAEDKSTQDSTQDTTDESTGTVPSQADLLRKEGELLGVGMKKGEIRLDTIIKWVQRTANLDDLNSVWNALTEMAVANDVKKRWIKLYAQDLPSQKIPDELKEKLESGQEDKVGTEAKAGEIAPKPKRFSLIGNDIIGDPEGDLTFKEALQERAQNLGVPSDQAGPLAVMIDAMKAGQDQGTAALDRVIAVMTNKDTAKRGDDPLIVLMQSQQTASQNQMQLLQQMVMTITEEKHKAELESLRAEMRTGQKPPESNQQIQALTDQINSLRESLHQQQIATIQEQNKAVIERMEYQIGKMEQQIALASQGRSVDSKIGLLDKTLDKGAQELSGVRQDLKGLAQMMMAKGEPLPKPRSTQEKQGFKDGLTKGIEKAEEARRQAQELWASPQS